MFVETNDKFFSTLLNVFKNKFEFVIKINKDKISSYEILAINKNVKKKEHLYPDLNTGNYLEYLNDYIFKYLLITKDYVKEKFNFNNIYRFLDGDYEYSFDADFILNKERVNKKFSCYLDGKNSIIIFVEDNTKYKTVEYLDALKSIKNCSLIYQVKNDRKSYYIDYVSEGFAKFVGKTSQELFQILAKNHPFDLMNKEDVLRISELICGNEKNDSNVSFVVKMKLSSKVVNCKIDLSYFLLGKKLYCYAIFEDITDILKLNELSSELKETKERNKSLALENQTDALTGLGNETKYKAVTKILEEDIKKGFKDFAVCVCDVNGVKVTNDKYGHQFGCHMIVTAGHTFPAYFKTSDIFHIGGDEYVIIVRGNDYLNLDSILSRIRNVLEYQYMEFEGVKLRLSVAIGCSRFMDTDKCYHDPFQRADDDMYKRKIAIKTLHGIPLR